MVSAMWMLAGANGYAMDEKGTTFDGIIFDRGRILAIGETSELKLQFGSKLSRIVDVEGATVVPGLVDNHIHVVGVAEQMTRLDVTGVASKTELLERIRSWARTLRDGEWIVGGGWDENRFTKSKELPTMAELDEASLGHPLFLARVCRHAYLANRLAFTESGLGENPANPADGAYGRDACGLLNGVIYENASKPLFAALPKWTHSDWKKALALAMKHSLSVGLTAVHTDDTRYLGGFTPTWQYYHELIRENGIRLRVNELVDFSRMEEYQRAMPDLPGEDDWLSVGAAKLFSDGAMGGRTAWLSMPYHDDPSTSGMLIYAPEELKRRVRVAHEAGLPVAIHAIGDAGLEATIAAIEAAPSVDKRDRIVHAQLIRPDLVRRMARLGDKLAIDVQPRFTCSDFPWIMDRLGVERAANVCAWRTMKEAGLHIGGGSDAPIEPVDPLLGIHAAVTRRAPYETGEGYFMEQALSPREAVALFAEDACYAIGLEGKKGRILPGWMGDVTVLDRDIVNPSNVDDIRDAKVRLTIVGGRVAYSSDGEVMEELA